MVVYRRESGKPSFSSLVVLYLPVAFPLTNLTKAEIKLPATLMLKDFLIDIISQADSLWVQDIHLHIPY